MVYTTLQFYVVLFGMGAKSFEDLLVWQKAHAYVLDVYKITEGFPKSELFSLTSQMRRAAVSIPANIAEGFKKRGPRDKVRFLNTGQGSLEESLYYLILSNDLGLRRLANSSPPARRRLKDAGRLHSRDRAQDFHRLAPLLAPSS